MINVFENLVLFEFKDCRKLTTELGIFRKSPVNLSSEDNIADLFVLLFFFTVETTYLNKFSGFSSYHL